jgi:hypothetical protein
MAKGTSFSEKAKGKKDKSQTFVKYVKSSKSDKTGHWRFNEQMIGLNSDENLDSALKRIQNASLALDIEMPKVEELKEEVAVSESAEAETDTNPDEVEADEENKVVAKEESSEDKAMDDNSGQKSSDEEESVIEKKDSESIETVVEEKTEENKPDEKVED